MFKVQNPGKTLGEGFLYNCTHAADRTGKEKVKQGLEVADPSAVGPRGHDETVRTPQVVVTILEMF